MEIAYVEKTVQKYIHSWYNLLDFIKWKLVVTYFLFQQGRHVIIHVGFTQLAGHSKWCGRFLVVITSSGSGLFPYRNLFRNIIIYQNIQNLPLPRHIDIFLLVK